MSKQKIITNKDFTLILSDVIIRVASVSNSETQQQEFYVIAFNANCPNTELDFSNTNLFVLNSKAWNTIEEAYDFKDAIVRALEQDSVAHVDEMEEYYRENIKQ